MHIHEVAVLPEKIVLGICTYERPEMLLRCLSSVSRLIAPHQTRLEIVIVDNEPEPTVTHIVSAKFTAEVNNYVHEPRRGIAHARNAILDKAEELGADWIAMLDDDQRVAPDWLDQLWSAKREISNADVIRSAVDMQIPQACPQLPWAFPKKLRSRWKLNARHASTNGVLFRAGLLGQNGEPLRFSERYNLTGGEDRDFFRRAWRAGARIVWTPEAIAFETVPATKLTYAAQVHRAYWIAVVNARQDREMFGLFAVTCSHSISFTASLISGLAYVLTSPFGRLHNERAGRARFLRGSKKIAKAVGIVVGLTRTVPLEPYRTIHGS